MNDPNNPSEMLIHLGGSLRRLGFKLGLFEAALAREGISLEPPASTEVAGDVCEEARRAILVMYAEVQSGLMNEEDWLAAGGYRDRLCVRWNLSRKQVRSICAGASRSSDEDEVEIEEAPGVDAPAEAGASDAPSEPPSNDLDHITVDPETWPERELEDGGVRAEAPKRKIHEVDAIDSVIILRVRRQCDAGKADWNEVRRNICQVRRLYPHQLAGVVASARRAGRLAPRTASRSRSPSSRRPRASRSSASAPPEQTSTVKAEDPKTWGPARQPKRGRPDAPPDRYEYKLADRDRDVIRAIHSAEVPEDQRRSLLHQAGAHLRITDRQMRTAMQA